MICKGFRLIQQLLNNLNNQDFSYQKPLALFSDSSGENKLIFNALGLDFKGKIKTIELEIPPQRTFEAGTFKGKSLELGIRQEQNSFLDYGLIQAEEVTGNKQISFTTENNVRFAFLNGKVVIGEPNNNSTVVICLSPLLIRL